MDSIHASRIANAADTLLKRFGEDSAHQASIRSIELANRADEEGAELWRNIELELRARLVAKQADTDN